MGDLVLIRDKPVQEGRRADLTDVDKKFHADNMLHLQHSTKKCRNFARSFGSKMLLGRVFTSWICWRLASNRE